MLEHGADLDRGWRGDRSFTAPSMSVGEGGLSLGRPWRQAAARRRAWRIDLGLDVLRARSSTDVHSVVFTARTPSDRRYIWPMEEDAAGREAPATARGGDASGAGSPAEVLRVAFRLGLTSFGGAIAHFGYFRREYVERRRWLDEATFADLLALAQSLPGPASSQLGMAIGYRRAGLGGALAAWLGFTLPSAVILIAFATATTSVDLSHAGWVHGLKLAAVAVVASAVLAMWRALAPDVPAIARRPRRGRRRPPVDLAARAARHDRARGGRRTAAPRRARGGTGTGTGLAPSAAGDSPAAGGARSRSRSSARCCSGCPSSGSRPAPRSWRRPTRSIGVARSCSVAVTWCCRCSTRRSSTRAGSATTGSSPATASTQAVPGPLFTFAGYLGAASSLPPNGVVGGVDRHRRDLPAVAPPARRPAARPGTPCAAGPGPARRSSG